MGIDKIKRRRSFKIDTVSIQEPCFIAVASALNPVMFNVVKWPNILLKSCSVNTARFLKYVWSFYSIMHERVKYT